MKLLHRLIMLACIVAAQVINAEDQPAGKTPPGARADRGPSHADGIAWGGVVNGLQMGISPKAGASGVPEAPFDGAALHLNVHLRNVGKSEARLLPNTFGCAAMGSGAAIFVTKLVLTPGKGGEPLSITHQSHNHVSDQRPLDAGDVEYYTTVLAPREALRFPYPVEYTPGKDRTTSWRRTGGSNLVPEGKYQVKAVFVVDRKESQWKGELTSGSFEIEIHPLKKR